MSPVRTILAVLAALYACGSAAAQTYVLLTPDTTLNSDSWALGSANLSGFKAALTNPVYFGPSGTVHTSINVNEVSTVTAGNLGAADGIFVPWWNNSQSAPFQSVIISAFLGGKDLWLLEDDSAHNGIGTALGIVSSNADGSASTGAAPFFSGPFGVAASVSTFGNFSYFDASTITTLGGTVVGRNGSNNATIVYWPRHTFSATSGALVLFGDVDMISNWAQNPYSPSLGPNGILALNTAAVLASPIPEPGAFALLAGLVAVAVVLRRQLSWFVSR
jgi:hypothetical protein